MKISSLFFVRFFFFLGKVNFRCRKKESIFHVKTADRQQVLRCVLFVCVHARNVRVHAAVEKRFLPFGITFEWRTIETVYIQLRSVSPTSNWTNNGMEIIACNCSSSFLPCSLPQSRPSDFRVFAFSESSVESGGARWQSVTVTQMSKNRIEENRRDSHFFVPRCTAHTEHTEHTHTQCL